MNWLLQNTHAKTKTSKSTPYLCAWEATGIWFSFWHFMNHFWISFLSMAFGAMSMCRRGKHSLSGGFSSTALLVVMALVDFLVIFNVISQTQPNILPSLKTKATPSTQIFIPREKDQRESCKVKSVWTRALQPKRTGGARLLHAWNVRSTL